MGVRFTPGRDVIFVPLACSEKVVNILSDAPVLVAGAVSGEIDVFGNINFVIVGSECVRAFL